MSYITLFKMRFKRIFAYRVAALAGIFTQSFFGFLLVMKYQSFYQSNSGGQPLLYQQTLNYIWLGQILFSTLPWMGDREIQSMIRTGNVTYEWLRPMDLYFHWFFRSTATRMAGLCVRLIPFLFVVCVCVPKDIQMTGPDSWYGLVGFVLSLGVGFLLGSSIQTFITAITLTTLSELGPDRFMAALVSFFSGMIIPLPFFPESWQWFVRYSPIAGVLDMPIKYYLGTYTFQDLPLTLLTQLFWLGIMILVTRHMIEVARKKMEIMGG